MLLKQKTPEKISENIFDFVGLYEENNLNDEMILIIWKNLFITP